MAAKLDDAIKKWKTASHKDNRAFEDDLAVLYERLIEGLGLELDKIQKFLNGNAGFMDRCVRWHLLKLAIERVQTSMIDEHLKIDAHLKLAMTIMESEEEVWDLLLLRPTANKLQKPCKWKPDGEKSGIAKQKSNEQQQNPHYRKKTNPPEKALFSNALYENHPYIEELLAKMQELYAGQPGPKKPFEDCFAGRVRDAKSGRSIHDDLPKKAGWALYHVLIRIPRFLVVSDRKLLDKIIERRFLGLAEAILASENHYKLLTTRERIVKALENWLRWQGVLPPANQDSQDQNPRDDSNSDSDNDDDDDDDDDGGGDDIASHQDLAIRLLSEAPEDVLRSPEVLTVVMRHSLLDDADILQAYARDTKDARVPSASFQPVASFLQNVPGVLHMAVVYQQRPLVEALLRTKPELVINRAYVQTTTAGGTIPPRIRQEAPAETAPAALDAPTGTNGEPPGRDGDSGYYPLWYNNKAKVGDKATRTAELRHVQDDKDRPEAQKQRHLVWEKIRSALIYCTMKHAENLQTLLTILRDSREPESEINFDISHLHIEGTSVADFVTSMTRKGKSYSLIRYEETIRYADFPVLDRSTQPQVPVAQNLPRSHLQHAHTEIPEMLDWLGSHGVNRIINLRVPDRMANPHDELEIARAVKRFRVEELDWRILDLSLNIFRPHGALGSIPLVCTMNNESTKDDKKTDMRETYLRRLHLYTGGRRSALDHWFSAEGLESMNLDYVCIHVIKELTTKTQSAAILQYINGKIAELEKRKQSMQMDVQSQFWTAQTETPRLQEIIHHLSPRLAQFIAHYCHRASEVHAAHKHFRPAKVAIIDNGILSMDPPSAQRSASSGSSTGPETPADIHSRSKQHLQSPEFLTPDNLWARICDGKSFVNEPNRVSPWYLASNPHGTQMANLVCAIDPLCQLFIAKIADSHYGYSAARAAEAVRWAVEKEVDIISMSFTTIENDPEFTRAVQAAMDAGILIVCSHHDEGARIGTVIYPACLISRGDNNTMLRMASCDMYGRLQHDGNDNASDSSSRNNDQYEFCINSQDVTVGVIPFLASSTERIGGSSVATAIAAGVCSLLIACLRTVHQMTSNDDKAVGNPERRRYLERTHDNVRRALHGNYRPSYTDIKKYLETMAPSNTTPRFISLDRFARLDELRDVNTSSLLKQLLALGENFPAK